MLLELEVAPDNNARPTGRMVGGASRKQGRNRIGRDLDNRSCFGRNQNSRRRLKHTSRSCAEPRPEPPSEFKQKPTMSHWSYILKTLRPHRKRLVLALGAMLGITLVDLGSPLVTALLVDVVLTQGRYEMLGPLMLAFLALPFLAAVCQFVSSFIVTLLGQRLVFDIRLDLYRHIQRLHCRFIQNATTGKLMERLRGDVLQLQGILTEQTPQLLVQVVTGLIMVVVMLLISVKLTLVVLLGIGLYVVNYKVLVPRIRRIQRRYRGKMDRLSALAQERLSGALAVKSFGRERAESRSFLRRNFLAERVFHRYRMTSLTYGTISYAIMWGNNAIVILLGAWLVVRGEISYGMAIAFSSFAFRLLKPAAMLAELSNQLQQARVSMDRIFELMQADQDAIVLPGRKLDNLRGEVRFENVSFEYEEGKNILNNLNLHVKPGQTIALVGPTGCGKTTIMNLLYRYHEIDQGRILIDGHDMRELSTHWYRRRLALVPQEPIVFNATIAENIAYGRRNATDEQIETAAGAAELGALLERLPEGIHTRLGAESVTLSVGEKQRMCIARAILADPAILILDEATSSLDTHSEMLIQLALRRVMANRTCFVVAHRLSTIVNADVIAVMDCGHIVESGSHAQLLRIPGGKYRSLYETQMASIKRARTA